MLGRGAATGLRKLIARLFLKKLTLLLVTVVVVLMLLEVIVRIFVPQSVAVPWQDEVNGITAPRTNIHGRHAVPHTFDVTISFNAQRFRGTGTYTQTPAPGVLRIAALGDSFTFGFGANDAESYPADLERNLQSAHAEVINAANAGTGTGEQALWYDTWVKSFHPQIVLLAVTGNDVDDDAVRRPFALDEKGVAVPRALHSTAVNKPRRFINAIPGYSYVAEHTQLWGLIRNALSEALAPQRLSASTSDTFTRGLPLLSAEILWLENRVRADHALLVVVFVPGRESICESAAPGAETARVKSNAIISALSASCARDQIPFLDVSPELKTRNSKLLYYDGLDTHPTPEGYRAIAEIIAGFIAERKIAVSPPASSREKEPAK